MTPANQHKPHLKPETTRTSRSILAKQHIAGPNFEFRLLVLNVVLIALAIAISDKGNFKNNSKTFKPTVLE
jgi:hypothetical protein